MAKITRKHQKVFAGSAANNGQFGSAQTGAKVTSDDPDVIQALAAFDAGWNDATISSQRLPTLEEMQALSYLHTRNDAYFFQEGIPEYHASTEYHQFSVCKKSGTYELYGSLINTNTGNPLPFQTDNANWKYLGDLSNLSGNLGLTQGAAVATTSGTAIDFTGIPAGTKQIIINFSNVSLSGSDDLMIQLGDSAGFETSGYIGGASQPGIGGDVNSSSFQVTRGAVSNTGAVGSAILSLTDESTFSWTQSAVLGRSDGSAVPAISSGAKSLNGELAQIRISTSGSNTFDAGIINIQYQ